MHPRDEGGAKALAELQDRGISLVAKALAQSADHVGSFFDMLRTELAFYVGCVNLHEELGQKTEPLCPPSPVTAEERRLSFRGLYDVSLALSMEQLVVGNDANADEQDLVIVTGQPGWQIDVSTKHWLSSIDDAKRDVRAGRVILFQPLQRAFHALQTGRRYWYEKWKAR